jgi:hypothetical protein
MYDTQLARVDKACAEFIEWYGDYDALICDAASADEYGDEDAEMLRQDAARARACVVEALAVLRAALFES